MPEGQEENCSNPDSHLVSHDSTNESLPCLTLLIGREAVFSWRYGRRWRWKRCDRPYTYDLALLPQVKKVKRPTPFRFRGHPHPGSKKKIRLRRVWPSDFRLRTPDSRSTSRSSPSRPRPRPMSTSPSPRPPK